MIVSQADIRNRIEELKFSFEGYRRQVSRPGISDERRERLERGVRLWEEELATLEKLAQFGRVEPDRDKIEAEVRSRISILRERLANDPALSDIPEEYRALTSGELVALQWAVGEDKLAQATEEWTMKTVPDPTRLDRTLPPLLVMTIHESPDPQARANAAYDAGQLHIVEAIPALSVALGDEGDVAEIALGALCLFTDDELVRAGLRGEVVERVRETRKARGR